MKKLYSLNIILLLISAVIPAAAQVNYETDLFKITIERPGYITSIFDKVNQKEYFPEGEKAPLLQVRCGGKYYRPTHLSAGRPFGVFILNYDSCGARVRFQYQYEKDYITFEITMFESERPVDLILWGPYPTTIRETVGETVGVVRNSEFAFGIQALNERTLGGYPENENDVMPMYDIFENGNYKDIKAGTQEKLLYRGNTARFSPFGSTIQAYARDRSRARVIPNWKHEKYYVPPYKDGGLNGSKIALFGCPPDKALGIIGTIELENGLPHPSLNGKWAKTAPEASSSYMILGFGENNIDKAIEFTKKAGLKYLYHPGPFETWGHFKLKEKQFPHGIRSLKSCVEKANNAGIDVGVHFLSNFITTNDPYVTPVPDHRLAQVGSSELTADISKTASEIGIESPDFFNQMKNNSLKTVIIGSELIRYRAVSETAPWKLLDCRRGAFGTHDSSHKKGDAIGKLIDHGYKVFLTNAELQNEVALRIADIFNRTGLKQISFDGLEGCWSAGMGQYSRTLFTKKWYDSLNDKLRGHVICDASNPGHYFWHIYTRMNWGEPWYAGFRESQTQYRLQNQKYFSRNLMPHMLGWFQLTGITSLEDIEWLLARAAGFDAGFALVSSYDTFEKNGITDTLLETIKQWEHLRLSGMFTPEQKRLMQDVSNEYHLEKNEEGYWSLYPVYNLIAKHKYRELQPGQPTESEFTFDNPADKKPMQFMIQAPPDADISNISLEVDSFFEIKIPVTLKAGQILKSDRDGGVILYDMNWNKINSIVRKDNNYIMPAGNHSIVFNCSFSSPAKEAVKLEFKTMGIPEFIKEYPR